MQSFIYQVCIGTLSRNKGYIRHDPPIPVEAERKPSRSVRELEESQQLKNRIAKAINEMAERKAMP